MAGLKALNQTYYRNVNPDLLNRIPLNARTVVEVGCGSGALGAAYKLRNPSVRYLGIESMPGPAALASELLDDVICGDVEDPSCGFLKTLNMRSVSPKKRNLLFFEILNKWFNNFQQIQHGIPVA